MLTIPRLNRIRLTSKPRAQRMIAGGFLEANYSKLPGIEIQIENPERIPDEPVIYAMNHTDRYNYWPFQYKLWKQLDRYTATWVKGKYYENWFVGGFMEMTNNLPTVSRGYIITRDTLNTLGRVPTDEEYKALRAWVDAVAAPGVDASAQAKHAESIVPTDILTTGRDILGRTFDPTAESFADAVNAVFTAMMRRFTQLNVEAFDIGLDLLIFPQGTRSVQLSKGHIGIAEIALRYKRTVVPVGCNGTDRIYPTSSPVARKGTAVYRIGEPIRYTDVPEFHIPNDFEPFSATAEHTHREQFRGYVDMMMDRINELLDPRHQFSDDRSSAGVAGSNRFV